MEIFLWLSIRIILHLNCCNNISIFLSAQISPYDLKWHKIESRSARNSQVSSVLLGSFMLLALQKQKLLNFFTLIVHFLFLLYLILIWKSFHLSLSKNNLQLFFVFKSPTGRNEMWYFIITILFHKEEHSFLATTSEVILKMRNIRAT